MNPPRSPNKNQCIIVFGRYPRPGHVKTRLIPCLGPLGAAELQRQLTEKVLGVLLNSGLAMVRFCYSGANHHQVRRWLGRPALEVRHQTRGNLGQRMAAALDSALEEGYRQVLLVGTDLPDITADHVAAAFQTLDSHDLVLGPSTDGGYWLVGTKTPLAVFDRIPWGSERVMAKTLAAAALQGLKTAVLEPLNDIDTPADLDAWQPDRRWQRPFLSIILPTLNEAARIESAIDQVRSPHSQVIVVDGGSRDETVHLARNSGAQVFRPNHQGRAIQQNTGAAVANGRVLLFLHADTRLPDDFESQLFEVLMNPNVALGAFRFKTDLNSPGMRLIEWAAHIRSTRFHLPYGDQAFFLHKHRFEQVGGFPDVPIAEDLLLARRLVRSGRVELAPGHAITSARRWRDLGMGRTTLINYLIAGGCLLGVDPARLAPLYDRWMKKKKSNPVFGKSRP